MNGRLRDQPVFGRHRVSGVAGNVPSGPDLARPMGRGTIGAGRALNTPENLRKWIQDSSSIKPGTTMPAFQLSDRQIEKLTPETLY